MWKGFIFSIQFVLGTSVVSRLAPALMVRFSSFPFPNLATHFGHVSKSVT